MKITIEITVNEEDFIPPCDASEISALFAGIDDGSVNATYEQWTKESE